MASNRFHFYDAVAAQAASQARTRSFAAEPEKPEETDLETTATEDRHSVPRNVAGTPAATPVVKPEDFDDYGVLLPAAERDKYLASIQPETHTEESTPYTPVTEPVYSGEPMPEPKTPKAPKTSPVSKEQRQARADSAWMEGIQNANKVVTNRDSKKSYAANNAKISGVNAALKDSVYSIKQPTFEQSVDKKPISTRQAWDAVQNLHTVLTNHLTNLLGTKQDLLKKVENTHNTVARLNPNHPSLGVLDRKGQLLSADIQSLRNGGELPLKLRLNVANRLVEAISQLNTVKEYGKKGVVDSGSKFRTDISDDQIRDHIKYAHKLLSGAATYLENNDSAGSPIHPEYLQMLRNKLDSSLPSAKARPIPLEHQEPDVDEVTGEQARPGHVFVGTRRPNGSLEQMEATAENVALLRSKYGKQSASAARMAAFIRRNSGVPTRVGGRGEAVETHTVRPGTELPVVEAGRGGHVYTGETEVTTGGRVVNRQGRARNPKK